MKRIILKCIVMVTLMVLSTNAATISGTVKDSASKAELSGMLVTLKMPGARGAVVKDTTDAKGAFSFTADSVSGTFNLRITDMAANANYPDRDTSLKVTATGSATVTIVLAKILKTTISGVVGDSGKNAAPIPGAVVALKSTSGTAIGVDTTAADGKFEFKNVTSGKYFLSASAPKYLKRTLSGDTIKVTSDQPITRNFNLIAIIYGALSGIVTSSDSVAAPVKGVVVALKPIASPASAGYKDTTGDDGSYKFDSVETGAYFISVAAHGYVSKTMSDTVKIADMSPVAKNLKITAIIYCTVSGIIQSDSASPAPIKGATVTLRSAAAFTGGRKATTGEDG